MVSKINYQKKVTRDALNYVAEINRDKNMLSLDKSTNSVEKQESVSFEKDKSELDPQEEKLRLREEQLIEILKQCEIPK